MRRGGVALRSVEERLWLVSRCSGQRVHLPSSVPAHAGSQTSLQSLHGERTWKRLADAEHPSFTRNSCHQRAQTDVRSSLCGPKMLIYSSVVVVQPMSAILFKDLTSHSFQDVVRGNERLQWRWSVSVCLQFADWCMSYGKHGCRTPDTPFSLFEGKKKTKNKNTHPRISWCSALGLKIICSAWFAFSGMAGTIYFLVDLLQPAKARFPAFEVWNVPQLKRIAPLPVALTNVSLLLDVTVLLSPLYCYVSKVPESQRWEVFFNFFPLLWSVALCPQKWQKSLFLDVNAWWNRSVSR